MTIYQEEMQRKAQHYGCLTDYDEADQLLLISHKGVHLTSVNPEGFMYYNNKDLTDPESREVFSHLVDDAEVVREYVGLYVSAPQMQPKDVQNYRKFSEYGDVVFAGMYSEKHGFMFCSWRQSDGGKCPRRLLSRLPLLQRKLCSPRRTHRQRQNLHAGRSGGTVQVRSLRKK